MPFRSTSSGTRCAILLSALSPRLWMRLTMQRFYWKLREWLLCLYRLWMWAASRPFDHRPLLTAMEGWGYSVSVMDNFLLVLFEKYAELLKRRFSDDFQEVRVRCSAENVILTLIRSSRPMITCQCPLVISTSTTKLSTLVGSHRTSQEKISRVYRLPDHSNIC